MKTKLNRIVILSLLSITMVTLAACNRQVVEDSESVEILLPRVEAVDLSGDRKLAVVATTTLIGDVVSNIGGEMIDLTVLIEPGKDPHSYELTPRAVVSIQQADLIFVNGLDLEEALLDSIESNAGGVIIPVSAGIEPHAIGGHDHPEGEDEDHDDTGADPHFWTNPNNVIIWVDNIEQMLSAADPANQDGYEVNAAAYRQELLAVDAYIREQVARIPEDNRKLVTDHGLFTYFAEEYSFEVIGTVVPSFSSLAEPSASDVVALVEVIQREAVPAIFIGSTASPGLQGLADAIAKETGEKIRVLPLLTGSLAAKGQPGDSYLGYLRFNIDQIVLGLGG